MYITEDEQLQCFFNKLDALLRVSWLMLIIIIKIKIQNSLQRGMHCSLAEA